MLVKFTLQVEEVYTGVKLDSHREKIDFTSLIGTHFSGSESLTVVKSLTAVIVEG